MWSSAAVRGSLLVLLALAIGLGSAGPARADILKGNLRFADNAFADDGLALSNAIASGITTEPPGLTIKDVITGSDLSTFTVHFVAGVIELGFTNHQLVNGTGADLAIFEAMELNDEFSVAVFLSDHNMQTATSYIRYAPTDFGTVQGFGMNVAMVDLSDFGVPAGAEISWIRIMSDDSNSVEIAGAGARPVIEPLPEPATMLFLAAGGLAVLMGRRIRRTRTG